MQYTCFPGFVKAKEKTKKRTIPDAGPKEVTGTNRYSYGSSALCPAGNRRLCLQHPLPVADIDPFAELKPDFREVGYLPEAEFFVEGNTAFVG